MQEPHAAAAVRRTGQGGEGLDAARANEAGKANPGFKPGIRGSQTPGKPKAGIRETRNPGKPELA